MVRLLMLNCIFCRVEQAVHSVLYDQLTHWLLYGQLLDPHNELFIHTSKAESSDKADQTPDVEGLVSTINS